MIFIAVLFLFAVQASAAAGDVHGPAVEWIKEYPAAEIEVMSVCESSSGGYYAAGTGPGGRLVMRLDGSGNVLWKENIPGSDANGSIKLVQESPAGGLLLFADGEDLVKTTDEADFEWEFHQPFGKVYSVEVAPDGSGVLAGTYLQGFLTGVSPDGKEAWNRTFGVPEGGGQYVLRSVQNNPPGGFIVAGYIDPIFMITDYRGFLMKTDAEGNKIWARQYSGNMSGMIVSVACRPSGGYAATRLQVLEGPDNTTLLAPSVIFTNPEGGETGFVYYNESVSYLFHIMNAGDAGYYLSGLLMDESAESDEYKILRTDLSGTLLWEKSLGDEELRSFTPTSDGGFIISTADSEGGKSYLIKYGEDTATEQAPGFGIVAVFALPGAAAASLFFRKRSNQKPE